MSYAGTWQSVTSAWNFVWWGGKYYLRAFKTHYFGFRYVLFPVNVLSKQNCVMRHGMRKPHSLKLICYAVCVIDLNKYFAVFPGENTSDNICETWLNEIFLTSFQTALSDRHICRGLIMNSLLKNIWTCLNAWKNKNIFIKML